jgi:hypothetical protein
MRALLLSVGFAITGCMGTGKFDEPPEEAPPEQVEDADGPYAENDDPLDRPRVHLPADAKTRSFNATFNVEDPMKELGKVRSLLEGLGAEMVSVSSSPGYANVNARLPNEHCAGLPKKVRALGHVTVNESLSIADLKPNVQWIEDRLVRIDRADRELRRVLRAVRDETSADGLMLLRELAGNERRNLETQLTSFVDQARYCQVYVNFQSTTQPVLQR